MNNLKKECRMNKLVYGAFATALLAACAGNQPNDNDAVRARANAAYAEVPHGEESRASSVEAKSADPSAEGPSIQLSSATFRSAPTVLVSPALSGKMAASIDVIRQNPLAKTAMEVVNSYLTSRGYTVVSLESQAQLDEVVQLQSDIAGNDEVILLHHEVRVIKDLG